MVFLVHFSHDQCELEWFGCNILPAELSHGYSNSTPVHMDPFAYGCTCTLYIQWPLWSLCICQNSRQSLPNLRRTVIGYWFTQQLHTAMPLCVQRVCMHCVWDQMRSKLGACDWPSFKVNRPQISNSSMRNLYRDTNGKIKKHKLSITEGLRLLFEFNPFASGIPKVLLSPHNGIIFSENSVKISSH